MYFVELDFKDPWLKQYIIPRNFYRKYLYQLEYVNGDLVLFYLNILAVPSKIVFSRYISRFSVFCERVRTKECTIFMDTKNKKSGEYTAKTPTMSDVKVLASSKLTLVSVN